VIVLKEGNVFAEGTPADVLTPETLAEVFGVRARVMNGPDGIELVIVPVGRV
jgi:iron complex transport system ATP-binding protein